MWSQLVFIYLLPANVCVCFTDTIFKCLFFPLNLMMFSGIENIEETRYKKPEWIQVKEAEIGEFWLDFLNYFWDQSINSCVEDCEKCWCLFFKGSFFVQHSIFCHNRPNRLFLVLALVQTKWNVEKKTLWFSSDRCQKSCWRQPRCVIPSLCSPPQETTVKEARVEVCLEFGHQTSSHTPHRGGRS